MARVHNIPSSIDTLFAAPEAADLANVSDAAARSVELLPVGALAAPVVTAELDDGSLSVGAVHAAATAALGVAFCRNGAGGEGGEGDGDDGEEMHVCWFWLDWVRKCACLNSNIDIG
ncbi:predicted protein [Uncinocarpus reesii 1704]|uniref:Uncharacterized protein n=1 Tax=Uncinocarpus reesii (strain UAMH 1704) TaxID=336963 RepID=C4JQM8_UNCRE|nr:uncharacterized protein UREG_03373 [Uncinocarpus reesii 1704]EEP78527.1 predicted protein [Uncinocarpus reesii 1704]